MREMKDSGIEWIGKIPISTNLIKIKYRCNIEKGKLPKVTNTEKRGLPYIGANEMNGNPPTTYTTDNLLVCQNEDTLILWDGANAGLVATNLSGIVSSTVVRCRLSSSTFSSRFLFYCIKNAESYYRQKVTGTTIPHMNSKYIDETYMLDISLDKQQKIADFLDAKCAEIDTIIEKTKETIEEYKKLKQSVITKAVTKGIRPNRPMKDSGIDWIGEIPENWNLVKLKSLSNQISKGATPKNMNIEQNSIYSIRFLKSENIVNNILRNQPQFFITEETHTNELKRSQLRKEDILFVIAGASIGKVCIIDDKLLPANTNQAMAFIRLKSDYLSIKKYIWYVLQSNLMKEFLLLFSVQSAQPNLSMSNLGLFKIPFSNCIEELFSITDYLDKKCAEIDTLISKKEAYITEMESYKKSLIYEYVTGKKEVKNFNDR